MEKIYVAKLGKAVGLKGQMRLFVESDFPEQFKKDKLFFTQKAQELTIDTINTQKDLVKFKGIDSVEDARKLTNSLLYTSAQESKSNCILGKNQYFWFDIMGCEIIEDGKKLGVVDDIQRLPLDDYLMVTTQKELVASYEKGATSFMIPYNQNFIEEVSIEDKIIKVKNALDIFEAS